jgi:hypothetical protein
MLVRLLRIALYIALMGVLCWFLAALAIPTAIRWEFAEASVRMLPTYGFFAGVALGLWMALSERVRNVVLFLLGVPFAISCLMWIAVLLIELALMLVGVTEDVGPRIMERVSGVSFWIGALLVLAAYGVAAYAILTDKKDLLLKRMRKQAMEKSR